MTTTRDDRYSRKDDEMMFDGRIPYRIFLDANLDEKMIDMLNVTYIIGKSIKFLV